ncbi:MAG: NRAMP family divalent metal transporter, partial [Gemmatimonadota bacterium]
MRGARPGLRASLGPGLLWAAAAIGVSHLVQSTRAGAVGGLSLAGVILAALVLKYPFFEYGPRYAAATGRSLVEGYREVGRWALWLYLLITLLTAAIVQAAILLFTASGVGRALGPGWPLPLVAALLYLLCGAIVLAGRFTALDRTVKAVMVVLALSTLAAAAVAAPDLDPAGLRLLPRTAGGEAVSLAFVLALAGWMPSAIDISVWSSLWTVAKDDELGYRSAYRHVMADFRIGYLGTGVMAFAFLLLGTVTMHQTGAAFSSSGMAFAGELVDLYAATLGEWMAPVVHVAVLATMFSTAITVIDGFPRAIDRTIAVLREDRAPAAGPAGAAPGRVYVVAMVALGFATSLIHLRFLGGMTAMVDVATIVTFLTAPALGYIN